MSNDNTLFKLLDPFRISIKLFFLLLVGVTPAEKLLELYHGKWGQSVDPIFEELLY